jgi:hypothetical protein
MTRPGEDPDEQQDELLRLDERLQRRQGRLEHDRLP